MKKIPCQFDASFINNTFYPHYVNNRELWIINVGQCFDWCYYAHLCWGNSIQLCSSDNHAFIEFNRKFFDAEHIRGMKNWQKLSACKILGNRHADYFDHVEDFMHQWHEPHHFRKLDRKFERIVCQ